MARVPYVRYLRHRHYDRVRYSTILKEWLEAMATKFSTTSDVVFEYLKKGFSAQQINDATSVPPVNEDPPVVSGTAQEGEVLSTTDGSWAGVPAPTFEYQWLRAAVPISGATSSTYTLTADDVSHFVNVRVTATNSEGSDSAQSDSVGPVAAL